MKTNNPLFANRVTPCNVTKRYGNSSNTMFVKLFQQILDSSIADNRRLRHFFTDLLLCADSSGMVMMTPHAIARRIGADVEEVLWGLEELAKPDPMSKTIDHEGRRIEQVEGHGYGWRILNYEHYRAMRDAEQMRESTRERVRRHRSKASNVTHVTPCNVTETNCNTSNAMQKEIQKKKEKEEEESVSVLSGTKSMAKAEEQEVREFCKANGLYPRDAEYLWNRWEGNGWKISGKPIKNWKSTIRAWKAQNYLPSQKEKLPEDYWPEDIAANMQTPDEDDLLATWERNKAKKAAEAAALAQEPEIEVTNDGEEPW